MALRLITPPAERPVSLEEAKEHLRVDHIDDDAKILLCIDAVTEHVGYEDGFLGRALIDSTWELVLDAFPENELKIPLPPLIEVLSIKYDDAAGNEFTLDPSEYTVDTVGEPGWVVPGSSWPATFAGINSVRIRFRAGYLDTSSPPLSVIPADIKAAMLMMIGTMYAQRETLVLGKTAVEVPWGADIILRRKRVEISMA